MLKLWSVGVWVGVPVGVPVRLGGSDCPASIGLIIFDSMSVESYETNVESFVGNESDALRLPLNRCLVSVLSRRTVYGFSFLGSVSSISMLVYLLDLLLRYDVVVLEYCYGYYY